MNKKLERIEAFSFNLSPEILNSKIVIDLFQDGIFALKQKMHFTKLLKVKNLDKCFTEKHSGVLI